MTTSSRRAFALAVLFGMLDFHAAARWGDAASAAAPDPNSIGTAIGMVTTTDGAAIRGAVVSLAGEGTAESEKTDAAGTFSVPTPLSSPPASERTASRSSCRLAEANSPALFSRGLRL